MRYENLEENRFERDHEPESDCLYCPVCTKSILRDHLKHFYFSPESINCPNCGRQVSVYDLEEST